MAKKEVRPGRAFGYGRASTAEQETTMKTQEDAVRSAHETRYKLAGYEWGEMFADRGVSGSVPLANRPAGYRLCLEVRRGDLVIVSKMDRGWRNAADCLNTIKLWQGQGVQLAVLDLNVDTGTPLGEALVGMLAVIAQLERGLISERMKEHWTTRKRQGLPIGGTPPYGFRKVGPRGAMRLVPDPEVRAIGSRVVGWVEQGWVYEQIYWHLHRAGVVHPLTGRTIGCTTLTRWYHAERALRAMEAANSE